MDEGTNERRNQSWYLGNGIIYYLIDMGETLRTSRMLMTITAILMSFCFNLGFA